MFVNVSGEESNTSETVASLEFATCVKKVDRSNVAVKKNVFDDSRRSSRNFSKYY